MAGLVVRDGVAGSGVGAAVGVAVSGDEKARGWRFLATWVLLIAVSLLVWLVVVGGVRMVMDWATS